MGQIITEETVFRVTIFGSLYKVVELYFLLLLRVVLRKSLLYLVGSSNHATVYITQAVCSLRDCISFLWEKHCIMSRLIVTSRPSNKLSIRNQLWARVSNFMKQIFLRRRKELKNWSIPVFTDSYRIIIKLENMIWDDIVPPHLPDVLRLQPISSENTWQEILFLFWWFSVAIPRLADIVFVVPTFFWSFMLRNIC